MDGCVEEWVSRWMCGWIDRWMDRWVDEWVSGCLGCWMDVLVDGSVG